MTEPTDRSSPGVKTLGVKLPDKIHAQFAMVAQLNRLSLNDAVLVAVQEYIDRNCAAEDFSARAAEALAAIEAEAEQRRSAIQALFAAESPATSEAAGTTRKPRGQQTSQ
jgi:hypothetical protein